MSDPEIKNHKMMMWSYRKKKMLVSEDDSQKNQRHNCIIDEDPMI